MPDEQGKKPNFTITKDEHGNTLIRDEAYQKYLDSTAPNPSQRSLDEQLARVTSVRIIKGEVIEGKALGTEVLYETKDTANIEALKECLRISEDPATFNHCMCHGDHAIELYEQQIPIIVLGLHHGYSIRWDKWKHDGAILDVDRLVNWLDERGVSSLKKQVEEDRQRESAAQRAKEIWISAMPKSIAAIWSQLDAGNMLDLVGNVAKSPQTTQKLYQCGVALQKDYPEKYERTLALLRWYGSGAFVTGAIPVYEAVPENLLRMYQPEEIVAAAQSRALTPIEIRGFLRILGDSSFREEHPCAHLLIPETFKNEILSRDDLDSEVADFAKNLFAGRYNFFFSIPNVKTLVQHYLKSATTPGDQIRANVTASLVYNGLRGEDWRKIHNDFNSSLDIDYLEKEIAYWKTEVKEIVKRNLEKYSSGD